MFLQLQRVAPAHHVEFIIEREFDFDEITKLNHTSMLIVRNPFVRIVSAYHARARNRGMSKLHFSMSMFWQAALVFMLPYPCVALYWVRLLTQHVVSVEFFGYPPMAVRFFGGDAISL